MTARDPIELVGGYWLLKPGGVRVWTEGQQHPERLTELAPGPCINCREMAIGLRCRRCRDEHEAAHGLHEHKGAA